MESNRLNKVTSLIKNLAAEFIQKESGGGSMITITNADISKDLKNSTIYISVLPESAEEKALNFTKRQRADFRDFVKANTDLRIVPFFDFKIDLGEKHRQRIEEIS